MSAGLMAARVSAWIIAGGLVVVPGDVENRRLRQDVERRVLRQAAIVKLGENRWRLSRPGMIQRMTEEFVQIIALAEQEMKPLYEGSRLVGYRVGRMQHCSFYRDLGLRDGDIIRSVNGQPVRTLYEMYLQFRTIRQAEVIIERRGWPVVLRYWIT